jgi:hypothetical protein
MATSNAPYKCPQEIPLHHSHTRVINGDAMQNHAHETTEDCGPEPFARYQRCQRREADMTTAAGEKVCHGCATPNETANGSAA